MTLSDLFAQIRNKHVSIPAQTHVQQKNGVVAVLSGLTAMRASLQAIGRVPGLDSLIQPIVSNSAFASDLDQLTVDTTTAGALVNATARLSAAIDGVQVVLEAVVHKFQENEIRVKLPPSSDYRGVVADQNKLLAALEQLLFIKPEFAHSIAIKGWEAGSPLWLTLSVGTSAAVVLIGSAVWAAAVIRKKIAEGDLIVKQVEALEVRNELLEHLKEKSKQAVDALVDTEAIALYEASINGTSPNEEIERVKNVLRELASMIARGTEIHPALMQPERAKELFPDFKALDTISSLIRQLPPSSGAS